MQHFVNSESVICKPSEFETAAFDRFWACYPRKVGKLDAWKAWKAAHVTRDLFARIVATLKWQCRAWDGDEVRFIPYPATWLRQGRWLDDPDPTMDLGPAQDFIRQC